MLFSIDNENTLNGIRYAFFIKKKQTNTKYMRTKKQFYFDRRFLPLPNLYQTSGSMVNHQKHSHQSQELDKDGC